LFFCDAKDTGIGKAGCGLEAVHEVIDDTGMLVRFFCEAGTGELNKMSQCPPRT
jgi:hypothetical protein